MEAFANGIPVIATAVGGSPEIVEDECGYLLDPNFVPNDLAILLENHQIDSEHMRVAALKKQRMEYSSIANQEKFAKEINENINEKR